MSEHAADTEPAVPSLAVEDGGERLVFHHLVRADDALSEFHRGRAYFTLCGRLLRTEDLPSSLCACYDREGDDCREVLVYCPDCLRDVGKVNAEWGAPSE